jgi:hypothetical protein
MDGCEECMPSWEAGKKWADCDLLDVYGRLCDAMPGEPDGQAWAGLRRGWNGAQCRVSQASGCCLACCALSGVLLSLT